MPALPDALFSGVIDSMRVKAIAGVGVGTKLIPELVELKPVGDALPELVHARAEAVAPRRLWAHGLGGSRHQKFTHNTLLAIHSWSRKSSRTTRSTASPTVSWWRSGQKKVC